MANACTLELHAILPQSPSLFSEDRICWSASQGKGGKGGKGKGFGQGHQGQHGQNGQGRGQPAPSGFQRCAVRVMRAKPRLLPPPSASTALVVHEDPSEIEMDPPPYESSGEGSENDEMFEGPIENPRNQEILDLVHEAASTAEATREILTPAVGHIFQKVETLEQRVQIVDQIGFSTETHFQQLGGRIENLENGHKTLTAQCSESFSRCQKYLDSLHEQMVQVDRKSEERFRALGIQAGVTEAQIEEKMDRIVAEMV